MTSDEVGGGGGEFEGVGSSRQADPRGAVGGEERREARRRGKHFYFYARRARASGRCERHARGPRPGSIVARFKQSLSKAGSGRVGRSRRSGRGELARPRFCGAPPRGGGRARLAPRDARRSGAFRGSGNGDAALAAGELVERRRRRRATKPNARRTSRGVTRGGRGRVNKCGPQIKRARTGRWRARRAPLGLGAAAQDVADGLLFLLGVEGDRPGGHGRASDRGHPARSRASPIRQPAERLGARATGRAPRAVLRRFEREIRPRANARAHASTAPPRARAP